MNIIEILHSYFRKLLFGQHKSLTVSSHKYLWSEEDMLCVPEKLKRKISMENWKIFVEKEIEMERNRNVASVPIDYEFQSADVGFEICADGQTIEKFLLIHKEEQNKGALL